MGRPGVSGLTCFVDAPHCAIQPPFQLMHNNPQCAVRHRFVAVQRLSHTLPLTDVRVRRAIFLMDPSQYTGYYGYVPYTEVNERWHDFDGCCMYIVHWGAAISSVNYKIPFIASKPPNQYTA